MAGPEALDGWEGPWVRVGTKPNPNQTRTKSNRLPGKSSVSKLEIWGPVSESVTSSRFSTGLSDRVRAS